MGLEWKLKKKKACHLITDILVTCNRRSLGDGLHIGSLDKDGSGIETQEKGECHLLEIYL